MTGRKRESFILGKADFAADSYRHHAGNWAKNLTQDKRKFADWRQLRPAQTCSKPLFPNDCFEWERKHVLWKLDWLSKKKLIK